MDEFVVCPSCGTRIKSGREFCLRCFGQLPTAGRPVKPTVWVSLGLSDTKKQIVVGAVAAIVLGLGVLIYVTAPPHVDETARPAVNVPPPRSASAQQESPASSGASSAVPDTASNISVFEPLSTRAEVMAAADLVAVENKRKTYESALAASPDDVGLLNDLGVALTQLGRQADAIPRFERALELTPDEPRIHTNLGNALTGAGLWDRAVAEYREAARLRSDNYFAQVHAGSRTPPQRRRSDGRRRAAESGETGAERSQRPDVARRQSRDTGPPRGGSERISPLSSASTGRARCQTVTRASSGSRTPINPATLKHAGARTDKGRGTRLMRSTRLLAVSMLLVAASGIVAMRAQSLADVAKKEEERRKTVSQPAKVYTNKDLSPAPPGSAQPADKDAKDAKTSGDVKNEKSDVKDGKNDDAKDGAKDQKYWSEKTKQLREQLERDKTFADAIQTKINALTTDFVNRDDPAQKRLIEADRQKAIAELGAVDQGDCRRPKSDRRLRGRSAPRGRSRRLVAVSFWPSQPPRPPVRA